MQIIAVTQQFKIIIFKFFWNAVGIIIDLSQKARAVAFCRLSTK